jgi:hypothetical protein
MGGRCDKPNELDPDEEITLNMAMRVLAKDRESFKIVAQKDHSFVSPRAAALTRGSTFAALLLWNYLKELPYREEDQPLLK